MVERPETQNSSIDELLARQAEALDRDLLAELGRFVVAFSQVVQSLEMHTVLAVGGFASPADAARDPRFPLLVGAFTRGEAHVAQETFFSVVGALGADTWTDDDNRIVKALRRRVNDVIGFRTGSHTTL
jgi:hypothetical protein